MKIINKLFESNKSVSTIEKKGKCIIVDKKYVIKFAKDKSVSNTYKYLQSRDFYNFPKIICVKDDYNIYEYIDEIKNPIEQKAYDMIGLLSLLHNKTTYYKEMDIDEYKKIYEDAINIIDSRNNYYNSLINNIENHMFMSPCEYLVARNISKIFESLNYSKKTIIAWYELVKTKAKKRIVTLYNNADLNHLIRNKDLYLLSWDKSKSGMPIYDLYDFYKRYFNVVDFENLLKHYEEKYPLLEEEKLLFYAIISIPNTINFSNNEVKNCKNVKKIIDMLYKSEVIINNNQE